MADVHDAIVIGAGGAGLFCAATAARRGRRVLVLEHGPAPGEKIRISGGGRCNFTNLHAAPKSFLSANPRFCISALAGYTPHDFIALVERHGIAWHEKTLGQLFCDGSARQIVAMLLAECAAGGAIVQMNTAISDVGHRDGQFVLTTSRGQYHSRALVIASGGLSIPKMGATGFGHDVAKRFGLGVVPTRPALVPLTFDETMLQQTADLAGVATDARVACGKGRFDEAVLFTHRGLSGPAILQISSYWREGEAVTIDMAPGRDAFTLLQQAKREQPRQETHNILSALVPRRLAVRVAEQTGCSGRIADLPDAKLRAAAQRLNDWRVIPNGTEGYRTAEVTLGGVDTRDLSSKTMTARSVPGLHFIGEVVDVTGHLGGFNFQWAWSSGHAAGMAL